MKPDTPCAAMQAGKRLEIRYDGFSRIVEVHAVGRSKEGNWLMRVWQVRGGSAHDEPVGWKSMRLDEAGIGHLTEEPSLAPRAGYRRGDKAMAGGIRCQL